MIELSLVRNIYTFTYNFFLYISASTVLVCHVTWQYRNMVCFLADFPRKTVESMARRVLFLCIFATALSQ